MKRCGRIKAIATIKLKYQKLQLIIKMSFFDKIEDVTIVDMFK